MADRIGLKYNMHLLKVESARLTRWLGKVASFLNRDELVDLVCLVTDTWRLEIRRECLTIRAMRSWCIVPTGMASANKCIIR